MLRRTLAWLTVVAAVVGGAAAPPRIGAHPPDNPFDEDNFSPITGGGPKVGLELVADGLVAPLKGTTAPGLSNHLFVPDQVGKLYAIDLTTGTKTVFLDVSALLVPLGVIFGPGCDPPVPAGSEPSFDERGLLGVAFHPSYPENGKFYTYTSEPATVPPTIPSAVPFTPDHQNVISEWIANDPADPVAGVNPLRRVLMRVDWPQFNHDGGDLAFGPDGKLYMSMGDGGGADDQDGQTFIVTGTCGASAPMVGHGPTGNGQNLASPLGKINRIDVNPPFTPGKEYAVPADNPFVGQAGAVPEIWAYGMRNPYRMSFDMATGALYLGNVGQNDIEEVERVVKGGNHGWRLKEGTLCFDPGDFTEDSGDADVCPAPVPGVVDPIAQYDTHLEGHSVIGGFVYHGSGFPALQGRYVFAEFSRLFNFPAGPNNYGRLLFLAQKPQAQTKLFNIQELNGFPEAAAALGLTDPSRPPAAFEQTLAVLGMGQDASGELYVTGNVNGIPFGTDGVVLRIVPANKK